MNKDIQQLRRECTGRGWSVEATGSGHLKWVHPSGEFFFSASTPRYQRVIKKIKNTIRKVEAGLPFRR